MKQRSSSPPSTQRSPWRLVSVPIVLVMMVIGVWGGLLRFGIDLSWLGREATRSRGATTAAELHGVIMIYGMLAALISLDRANHFRRWWGWLAPLGFMASTVALLAGASQAVGGAGYAASAVVLFALHAWGLTRRWSLAYATIGFAALFAAGGAIEWARGASLADTLIWWIAFLMITIIGERVQFGKLDRERGMHLTSALVSVGALVAGVYAIAASVSNSASAADVAARIFGIVIVFAAIAMLRIDSAAPKGGWPGKLDSLSTYYRSGIVLGYLWLAATGILWMMVGAVSDGQHVDSLIHMAALGFVLSMVFVHAPIVFPAVTARRFPFNVSFWLPLALLHLGVALRVIGDFSGRTTVAHRGADITALALLGFVATTVVSALRAARAKRAHDRKRGRRPQQTLGSEHIWITAVVVTSLVVGGVVRLAGHVGAAHAIWAVSIAVVLVPLTWSVLRLLMRGRFGVDLIALLAMAGALIVGEYLAGAVVALMLSGGNALEELAQHRAGRELALLTDRAPRSATVQRDGQVTTVEIDDVEVGDIVVVRRGEVVPVDGVLSSDTASFDQAALTGEPLPVELGQGERVMSGSVNASDACEIRSVSLARDSMYAALVRLVEQALLRKAPMVRMADRYSVLFLVVTLIVTAVAWILSGDPVRAIAVLVVATPCPLILAPPVALIGATSRAARLGIIIKGAAAVERLGRTGAVLLDKTGTLTTGVPVIVDIVPIGGEHSPDADRLLQLAASVEALSVHALAPVIAAAGAKLGRLFPATEIDDIPGSGIGATVDGHRVHVGSRSHLRDIAKVQVPADAASDDTTHAVAHIAIDANYAGRIDLSDVIREDAPELITRLGEIGITNIKLLTGDHEHAAHRVAAELGIDDVVFDCTPQHKLELVAAERERAQGRAVVMVGDGVNDAPALAAADVGIAMGGAGATAASASAEAVILSDRISRVADAISIGRRARRIALESIIAGMTLSIIGMFVAAAGYLPPVYGALTQEVIDLAVIVNALRVLGPGGHPE